MFRSLGTRSVRFVRRRWPWFVAIAALPVILLVAADVLLDEPIRRQVEHRMNERLKGYKVTLQKADFHVWGFSLDLLNLVVVQEANPDPPVARVPKLSASVQTSTWQAIGNLIRNAFFKAILPGFDEELARLARG